MTRRRFFTRTRTVIRRTYSRGRRYMARRRSSSAITTHIVPAMLGGAAVLAPFVAPIGSANGSILGEVMNAAKTGDMNSLTVAATSFKPALLSALPDIIILSAAAAGIGWAGRKFHLGRATRISKHAAAF